MLTLAQQEELERIERELGRLDVAIAVERRCQVRELNRKLEGLGLAPLSLPTLPHPSEIRAGRSTKKPAAALVTTGAAAGRIHRAFAAEAEVEGRTVDLRAVPYGVVATVSDAPTYEPYSERFLPGAFRAQTGDNPKVWLNFEHQRGLPGIIGNSLRLREEGDGLHGTFRVHQGPDGDKALGLIRSGILSGVSVEARAVRSRVVNGIVERVQAHLDAVAVCRSPAYSDAQVLAIRAD